MKAKKYDSLVILRDAGHLLATDEDDFLNSDLFDADDEHCLESAYLYRFMRYAMHELNDATVERIDKKIKKENEKDESCYGHYE